MPPVEALAQSTWPVIEALEGDEALAQQMEHAKDHKDKTSPDHSPVKNERRDSINSTTSFSPDDWVYTTHPPDTITPHQWRKKLVVVLVGLPARGKSYISHKILAFMR